MASILLVDDHPDLREVLGQLLQVHGHVVRYSETAEHAWAELGRCCPDVLIVDQRLPGISGIELLQRVRTDTQYSALPVIVYSADDSHRRAAQQAGADDFWLKGSESLFEGVSRLNERLGRPEADRRSCNTQDSA